VSSRSAPNQAPYASLGGIILNLDGLRSIAERKGPVWVRSRSFGDVASMSDLTEGGHGWAIFDALREKAFDVCLNPPRAPTPCLAVLPFGRSPSLDVVGCGRNCVR
jgi:hypothetical protein